MGNIFENHIINNEIHVCPSDWQIIKSKYSQKQIIEDISDAIELFDVRLPYRDISLNEVNSDYYNLKKISYIDLCKQGKWGSKFDYKFNFNEEYIDLSNVGNKASDFFHQVERWKCDATGYPSPQKTWDEKRFRLTLFKALFSMKVTEINPQIIRNLISLRKYIATQFRPSAAKTIYDIFEPKSVLDFSMGWGDRIVAAHAAKSVKYYDGIDPNINLFDGYVRQIKHYNAIDPENKTIFKLHLGCAEDEALILDKQYDLIFTSPPYFDKEKYNQSADQSYVKYKKFDSWLNDFLLKSIELRSENLKIGGYLVINISDIYTRKKLYQICDPMNDFIVNTGKFRYLGALGLRMSKRPQSISENTTGIYGEPIWVYQKIK